MDIDLSTTMQGEHLPIEVECPVRYSANDFSPVFGKENYMELGRLTLLCINLACIGAIVTLVFVVLLSMRPPAKRRPQLYSEPPVQRKSGFLSAWRNREEDVYASEEKSRVEV